MFRSVSWQVGLMIFLACSSVWAQENRVEISGVVGYTFSEGVPIDPIVVDGTRFDGVAPESGFSYGGSFDVFATEGAQVGFLWSQQQSTLLGKGQGTTKFADMKVNNYHGTFGFNWGDEDDVARPFIFGGIGATNYTPDAAMGFDVESTTRFSFTWGGGVKVYPSEHLGFRFTGKWTPTSINSDPAGIYCSPYWGCFQLTKTNYSNQFELAVGVTARF